MPANKNAKIRYPIRLMAVDMAGEQIINRLRNDGVHIREDNAPTPVDIVLVSSKEGVQNLSDIPSSYASTTKTVLIQMDSNLHIPEIPGIDSVLSFSPTVDFHNALKRFLLLMRNNIEAQKRPLICSDFYDFFTLIAGRRTLSVYSYKYEDDISMAISDPRSISSIKGARYLLTLALTQKALDSLTMAELLSIENMVKRKFRDADFINYNLTLSTSNEITQLISAPTSN